MIDSGDVSRAEDVVYNYLQENNLKIDYYLLTHFHSDHDGMLNELLEKYSHQTPRGNSPKEYIGGYCNKNGVFVKVFLSRQYYGLPIR